MSKPLLVIDDLTVEFRTEDGLARALDGVGFEVHAGEVVGVVGESGSGKSVTALSILGVVKPPGRIIRGSIRFRGQNLRSIAAKELRRIRGDEIAMIFQDPMTALNPVVKVGKQISEAIRLHSSVSAATARARALDLLASVGIPNPDTRYGQYPHEYSGGMRQRAMIAMAIANDPALLIADEPTTALDVTIQAQVLDLIRAARQRTGAATILITHDLGVIAEMADRVVVMYAGRVVEQGDVHTLFAAPRHPYTRGLLASRLRLDTPVGGLQPIPGSPPSLLTAPAGCPFEPRCPLARGRTLCRTERPALLPVTQAGTHTTACHFHLELRPEVSNTCLNRRYCESKD